MSRDMAHERRVAAERRERAMRAKRESALELDTGRRSLGPGPRGGCGEPASSVDSDEEDE